ncbi:gtpase activating protein [Lichtheimia corymbifera JMRC:FSU:9682]|uniref:Gtpase activating protein n=1 Tax=Lichtheimia corymbifera JMRC:FSU:9682 TaxID=1263082 RepID=A0A068S100_9FUNG|nr:gtpase activating protein [Lichtheimia corymbifera JMRC:FSU:9682]
MASHQHNQASSSSSSNRWLSNILRPRASSITVESCLNLQQQSDRHSPLDARTILPLVSSSQPVATRCRHLAAFSGLCRTYKFTHLDSVLEAVQDLLSDNQTHATTTTTTTTDSNHITTTTTTNEAARHAVFEFMIACIKGQYETLGLGRVALYKILVDYEHWQDLGDMYRVLYALCNGGRDISGFEKNVAKLLIRWLNVALEQGGGHSRQQAGGGVPHVRDLMHLLTMICKFNFAMFEEAEVTQMVKATRHVQQQCGPGPDTVACVAFADVVVRYRFVPFDALKPFMELLCNIQVSDTTSSSPKSVLANLLRSHCAHNAVLTLCRMATQGGRLATGAIGLLSEAAWGMREADTTYQIPDGIVLLYLRRAALHGDEHVQAAVLASLTMMTDHLGHEIALLEWDTIWDICDACTLTFTTRVLSTAERHILASFPLQQQQQQQPDNDNVLMVQFVQFLDQVYSAYKQGQYTGPIGRMMNVLHVLRQHLSVEASDALLAYLEAEHMLLPSTDGWIGRLVDVVHTFYIPTTVERHTRLRVLSIVTDVCTAIKDLHVEAVNRDVVLPMVANAPHESDPTIRQNTVDLIVDVLGDCSPDDESVFDGLLDVLKRCTRCRCIESPASLEKKRGALRRSQSQSQQHERVGSSVAHPVMPRSSTATPHNSSSPVVPIADPALIDADHCCTGIAAMCGLVELFDELVLRDTDGHACMRVFEALTELANSMDDMECVYGGSKVVALDILLRLRCTPDHRIFVLGEESNHSNSVMAAVRQRRAIRKQERANREKQNTLAVPPPAAPHGQASHRPRHPSPVVVSFADNDTTAIVLRTDEMLEGYTTILELSRSWELVLYVLERLPEQLGNKHLFCGAERAIERLRKRVVTWISTRRFLDSVQHLPSSIKRNDLYVHAYRILAVLIAYRRLFSKQHQDEIVYALYLGLTQVTAATRPCINALAVCCYELPLSVTKMLNEILQRMSQIISVSSVSVHILEFLSGLARLPTLYANFTSDMYKPVFAIALNYLQHSQAAAAAAANAPPQPPPSSSSSPATASSPVVGNGATSSGSGNTPSVTQRALSQYVLIMAYLVITVWFTAVPLRERRKHVSFIIQRLLSATPVGRPIDEQTYTCIDMLSRFSFADISLAPDKSLVARILMGDPVAGSMTTTTAAATTTTTTTMRQSTRSWVYGHTLLTLRTACTPGWAEFTIRRPSGTVSLMCNIENRIKAGAIDYKTLPALLMMQYAPELLPSRSQPENDQQQQQPSSPESPSSQQQQQAPSGSGLGITFDTAEPATATTTTTSSSSSSSPSTLNDQQQQQHHQSPIPPASPDRERSIKQVLADPAGNDPTTPSSAMSSHLLRRTDQSLDPGFLFLQLSNYPDMTRVAEMMPALPEDDATHRSIGILDRIPVVDFHKVGVLYVGRGQRTEVEILSNTHGSPDYVRFLNALGSIERLRGRTDNTGGLDREMDIDGRYAYFWRDDVTQMIFHAATMMPTDLTRDPRCSNKKRHIGNDFVTVVYNDSGHEYAFDTLPGQFNFINIVVTPHSPASSDPHSTFFRVEMQRRPDMPDIGPISDPKLVSAHSLPAFVRQTALHANIFAQVFQSGVSGRHEYLSHWRERLRQIRRIRDRVAGAKSTQQQQQQQPVSSPSSTSASASLVPPDLLLDFTRYT